MTRTSGVVIVDKPSGVTSHQVVGRLRGSWARRKIGHAGTLDPMATGRADPRRQPGHPAARAPGPARQALPGHRAAGRVLGHRRRRRRGGRPWPTPRPSRSGERGRGAEPLARRHPAGAQHAYSAIKVDGKRAYALARAGESVELKARPVTVSRLDVLAVRVDGRTPRRGPRHRVLVGHLRPGDRPRPRGRPRRRWAPHGAAGAPASGSTASTTPSSSATSRRS